MALEAMVNVIAPSAFFERSGAQVGLSAEDKLAMLELTARFEWCFDSRRLDVLETLLTDDVVIDHIFGLAQGKPDAIKMLREVVPFRNIRHQATNPVVFIDDQGRPAVLSYLMVVQVGDEDGKLTDQLPRVLAHALVTDLMRQEDGRWRIAGRTFEQMMLSRDYAPDADGWKAVQQTAAERAAARTQPAQA